MASIPGNLIQIGVAAAIVCVVIRPIEITAQKIGVHQFA